MPHKMMPFMALTKSSCVEQRGGTLLCTHDEFCHEVIQCILPQMIILPFITARTSVRTCRETYTLVVPHNEVLTDSTEDFRVPRKFHRT